MKRNKLTVYFYDPQKILTNIVDDLEHETFSDQIGIYESVTCERILVTKTHVNLITTDVIVPVDNRLFKSFSVQ